MEGRETEANFSVVSICQSKNKCILPYTERSECPTFVPADRPASFLPTSQIYSTFEWQLYTC